ncbi:MAG: transcription elongation factor GreA [Dehalococcoidia bacterium]|nr:transcription elongation factor GreA [Dehalococcoidia bacterium]
MQRKPIYLTSEGLAKLEAEVNHLRTVRRAEIANQIHQAKELADTVDNAEYDDAKNLQAFVEGRILTLERLIKDAVIISEEHATDSVKVGSTVILLTPEGDEENYTIVGSYEADPAKGRISNESPVGKAVLGRRVGDEVQVQAPGEMLRLTVVGIK